MPSVSRFQSRLHAGDLVEVRSREEILATLDERGTLDNLPFMPEMLRFCGQQLRVAAVAHKTCDTIERTGMRRMRSAVHLEGVRCDGAAHGDCEAACLIYWKDAWLKPVRGAAADSNPKHLASGQCDLRALEEATRIPGAAGEQARYRCQVTEVLRATTAWAWWSPHHYLLDVRSGNWSLSHVLRVLILASLRRMIRTGVGYRAMLAIHDWLAPRFRMHPFREVANQWGPIPRGAPTPGDDVQLKAGDWVRVRPRAEILKTLNDGGHNRGMHFDPEMVQYCGGHYRVRRLVRRIIDERSGRMLEMKNTCVALEGVVCKSEYSDRRLMCPRAILPYWRPVWLQKSAPPGGDVERPR